MSEKTLTLAAIVAMDPNVGAILDSVRRTASENGRWAEYERVKCLVQARVGWHAPDNAPNEIRTPRAYEIVMAALDRRLDGQEAESA